MVDAQRRNDPDTLAELDLDAIEQMHLRVIRAGESRFLSPLGRHLLENEIPVLIEQLRMLRGPTPAAAG